MLNQLRTAINIAQAIQADVDAIAAQPKRKRPLRLYTFEHTHSGGFRVTVTCGTRSIVRYELTRRRYDRFVHLANSGNYFIEIMNSDFGVAWMMRRAIA